MSRSLGTLTLDLIARTGGFEAGMDKAGRTANKKLRQIEREAQARAQAIEGAFKNIAAGVAAAWSALNAVQSVKAVADYADQLSKLSQRTGVAVEGLAALSYAASLNDATFDDLQNGLKGLSNKMLEAASKGGEAAAAFDALGVKVTDGAGKLRPAEEVLLDIADAFRTMQDGAGKAALANKLMEESGVRLIPTLNMGREGLAAMREESSRFDRALAELAPKAVELNDNLTRMQAQGRGAAAIIGNETIPVLNELAAEILKVGQQTQFWEGAATVARVTLETLAVVGANVAFVFATVGREIGGTLAQLEALSRLDFTAASAIGEMMREDAAAARAELDAFEQRILNPQGVENPPTLPPVQVTAAPLLPSAKPAGGVKGVGAGDPLADAAKAYSDAMRALAAAQLQADTAGQGLSATQQRLVELMSDPAFYAWPEAWREAYAAQAESVLASEAAAASQAQLNELIAATPTAQLEQQRATMQLLAQAFEAGRIGAEQFSEAAQAALGNTAPVENMKQGFFDLQQVANDAARTMTGAFSAFFTGQEGNIKSLLANFLKATAEMIMQAMILNLIVKPLMGWMGLPGFAKGGVFDGGGVKAFASGGVVDSPTLFKFASGGSFRTGVMGEAGPEAILPLKRGADGKLGVTLNGGGGDAGGGVSVVQNFNVQVESRGDDNDGRAQGEAISRELRQQMKAAVMEVLVDQKRPGGVLS